MKSFFKRLVCTNIDMEKDFLESPINSPTRTSHLKKEKYIPSSTTISSISDLKDQNEVPKTKHALKVLTYNLFMRPFGITSRWNDYKNQR